MDHLAETIDEDENPGAAFFVTWKAEDEVHADGSPRARGALIIKPSVGFGSVPGSAGPSAYHVMEKDLKPWELYDLSGAEGPENLDAMKGRTISRAIGRSGGRGRTTRTHMTRCSARGVHSSAAGTPLDAKACPSRRGSKIVRLPAAHALLGIFVCACARWWSESGACATCTWWKVAPSARIAAGQRERGAPTDAMAAER
ncbi:unnamed protein product [Phytophthora fragariaefolia]|uniref:Unnamed protein product n=1 Tax=Phytophthora fragariaefolia TaxID=1490495 RepID=A0A9W6TTR9_9STRA|nr:unnamed protein product [Phytophthora fragariaefolia]